MRIALVTESFDDATGVGRIASALAAGFSQSGEEVHTVGQWHDVAIPGVTHHAVPGVRFSPGISKLAMRHAGASIVKSLGCDVVHSYGVARGANVVAAQSCHLAGMDIREGFRRHVFSERNWGLFDRVALTDERALVEAHTTKLVIAVSTLVKQQLLNYYTIDAERIVVLPNGIHPTRFDLYKNQETRKVMRRQYAIEDQTKVLLFVGNEFDRKGLRVLIDALARLHPRDVCLLVAGKGDAAPYLRRAVLLGVEDKVKFLGVVSPPERLFAAADVFVFPTLYEPFGMVVIEAMAAGLPVITSKSCGAVEGMQHGLHGLFLDHPESVDEVYHTIKRILDEASLATSLAARSLETARGFAWDAIVPRFLDVYRQILRVHA